MSEHQQPFYGRFSMHLEKNSNKWDKDGMKRTACTRMTVSYTHTRCLVKWRLSNSSQTTEHDVTRRDRRATQLSEEGVVVRFVVEMPVLLLAARRQPRRTPRPVDARRPLRSDQPVVLVTLELDVVVVRHRLDVVAVLVLADVSDQQNFAVRYVARVVTRI